MRKRSVFENENAAFAERDFRGAPSGALVEIRIGFRRFPRTVEPVEVRVLVGSPFSDLPPRWLNAFHRLDVEARRRVGKLDDALRENPIPCPGPCNLRGSPPM